MIVYCEKHVEHIKTLCEQKAEVFMLNLAVRLVDILF